MLPLVSVITPSFNQGLYIEDTIRSVLDQNYMPLEYLVYDAGSTDDTRAVLARYRDRVRAVIEPDRGQSDAVNKGLHAARGEIIGWLNSDDIYLPGALSAAVEYLSSHPQCAMVYGEAYYITATGTIIERYPTGPISSLSTGCWICQPAVFMRRDAVAAVGYLDAELHHCMDYDLWLRLAARYEIGYVPQYFASTRLHSEAKSVAQQLDVRREVVKMTYRRLGAAPLPSLFGYAHLFAAERWHLHGDGRRGKVARLVVATGLTCLLALRYHRRLTRMDVGLVWARLQGRRQLNGGLQGATDSTRFAPNGSTR